MNQKIIIGIVFTFSLLIGSSNFGPRILNSDRDGIAPTPTEAFGVVSVDGDGKTKKYEPGNHQIPNDGKVMPGKPGASGK